MIVLLYVYVRDKHILCSKISKNTLFKLIITDFNKICNVKTTQDEVLS